MSTASNPVVPSFPVSPIVALHGQTSARGSAGPATSRIAWLILISLDMALSALAIPALLERVRSAIPSDLQAEINNPGLVDAAVRVGAYLSVPAHGLTLVVFALLAGSIERHLNSATFRLSPRIAMGVGWLLVCLSTIPMRLLTLAGLDWHRRGVGLLVSLVAVGVAVIVSRAQLARSTVMRRFLFVFISILFVLAMTVGK